MPTRHLLPSLLLTLALTSLPAHAAPTPTHTFSIGLSSFLLDNHPFRIRCREVHAARVPIEYWRHRFAVCSA